MSSIWFWQDSQRALGQVLTDDGVRRRISSQWQAGEVSSRLSGCTQGTAEHYSPPAQGDERSAPSPLLAAHTYRVMGEAAAIRGNIMGLEATRKTEWKWAFVHPNLTGIWLFFYPCKMFLIVKSALTQWCEEPAHHLH